MIYKKIKQRTFELIESASKGDILSKIFDIILIALILINMIIVVAETFDIPQKLRIIMTYTEIVSVIIFSVEYVLRVWTADLLYPQCNAFKARIKYIFSFMALIDLLAILPFYLLFIIPIDLRVLRALRVARLLRIFKEPLIKSRQKTVCTSCLHIFRHFAQKFSDIRQYAEELFEQTDEKSDGAICTNDLISASLK